MFLISIPVFWWIRTSFLERKVGNYNHKKGIFCDGLCGVWDVELSPCDFRTIKLPKKKVHMDKHFVSFLHKGISLKMLLWCVLQNIICVNIYTTRFLRVCLSGGLCIYPIMCKSLYIGWMVGVLRYSIQSRIRAGLYSMMEVLLPRPYIGDLHRPVFKDKQCNVLI